MTFVHQCSGCGNAFSSGHERDPICWKCRGGLIRDDAPADPAVGDPYAHGRRT